MRNRLEADRIKERADIVHVISGYVQLHPQNPDELVGLCPFHDEKTASLTVTISKQLFYCFGCQAAGDVFDFVKRIEGLSFGASVDQVAELSGIDVKTVPTPTRDIKPKVVATYSYVDEHGELLYEVQRIEPGGNGKSKEFSQRRLHPLTAEWVRGIKEGTYRRSDNGEWYAVRDGVQPTDDELPAVRRVLYNLPDILQSKDTIYVVEGEKDVESLRAAGLLGTTNSGGAAQKWLPEYNHFFRDRRVVVIPDNDEPGRKRAQAIVEALANIAQEVLYVTLSSGKDVSNFFEAGHTGKDLQRLVAETRIKTGGEILPANPEAERAILGAILAGASPAVVSSALAEDDFSDDANRRIFAASRALYEAGKRIDYVLLSNKLPGCAEAMRAIQAEFTATANIDAYIQIVKDKASLRKTILACRELERRCLVAQEDAAAVLEDASRVIASLGDGRVSSGGPLLPAEIIDNYPGGALGFLDPSTSDPGVRLPWSGLNALLVGMKSGQMVLLAARPSVGKSAAAMQVAVHVAESGTGVVVFSLEMSASEILQRAICSHSSVDFQRFRTGKLNSEERESVVRSTSKIMSLPLRIDDKAGCTVAAVHSSIRKLRGKTPIGLVVVDYVQLMTTSGRVENRNQEVTQISRGLKLAAKEFEIPFLVLAQLNRGNEKEKRAPVLSDLRESGSLEQDADTVIFLHRKQDAPGGITTPVDMMVAKQRQGPRATIPMLFLNSFLRFEQAEAV